MDVCDKIRYQLRMRWLGALSPPPCGGLVSEEVGWGYRLREDVCREERGEAKYFYL